jgi:hypothetical protein
MRLALVRHNNAVLPPDRTGRSDGGPSPVDGQLGAVDVVGVQTRNPGWDLFRDGGPGGETPRQVSARVDQVLSMLGELDGVCLLVAHG